MVGFIFGEGLQEELKKTLSKRATEVFRGFFTYLFLVRGGLIHGEGGEGSIIGSNILFTGRWAYN